MLKPVIDFDHGSYFGGKGAAGVVHQIINHIPAHSVFVSGFLGHCAVMRWKKPAARNIGYDLDPAVIAKWRDAAAGVEVYEKNFLDVLDDAVFQNAETFLYLDPPYIKETRKSRHRYKFELDNTQHAALLQKIKYLPCMVAISCYDSPYYHNALSYTWWKTEFPAQTRGGLATETLYMNYPPPEPSFLHDKRFLGSDFRAREKAKRRIRTIKSKIERLTAPEKARLSDWLRGLVASH